MTARHNGFEERAGCGTDIGVTVRRGRETVRDAPGDGGAKVVTDQVHTLRPTGVDKCPNVSVSSRSGSPVGASAERLAKTHAAAGPGIGIPERSAAG